MLRESKQPISKLKIDIDLNNRVYTSKKAEYRSLDFKFNELKDIPDNSKVMGYPSKDLRQFLKDNK